MNEIVTKLEKVKESISKLGTVFIFTLIARNDLEGKWDILISAEKLKQNNSQEDLTYVIEELKKEFNDDLTFLSRIVLLVKDEDFIKEIACALDKIKTSKGEVSGLKLSNITIRQMNIISSDFSGFNLTPSSSVVKKRSSKSKSVEKF